MTTEVLPQSSVPKSEFFISSIFRRAWAVFKENWLITYVVMLLPLTVAFIYMPLAERIQGESEILSVVFTIIYLLLQLIVGMGVLKAYLNIVRGEKVTVETFTRMVPLILSYLVASIIMGILVMVGLLLLIVPGVYLALKYMFVPYLIVDKGLGPIEAFKESKVLTKGIKWDLLGFIVAAVVLMYLGVFALIVGLLITVPVATLAYALLYVVMLKRQKTLAT
jgi:uncharacterized membrane protein